MVRTIGSWRATRDGFVVAVAAAGLTAGMALGPAAHADPATTPSPTPTASASAGTQAAGTAGSSSSAASSSSASSASSANAAATPATASGDVLDQLAQEYAVGSGGGQLSNLLKMSLKMRAMGYKPSKANLAEIAQAMDYRPNQIPLIEALKDAIAYQQKIRAQMEILQQYQQRQGANSAVMGAGQMPGDSNPGAPAAAAAAPAMPAAPTP